MKKPKRWDILVSYDEIPYRCTVLDATGCARNASPEDVWTADIIFRSDTPTTHEVYVQKNRYGPWGFLTWDCFLKSIPEQVRGILYADRVLSNASVETSETWKDILQEL